MSYGCGPATAPVHCTTTSAPPGVAPGDAELHGDAEPVEFADVPVDQRSVRSRHPGHTAELLAAFDDRHVVAADRRDPGGLQAGGAAADHHDRAGRARRLVPVGILGLATARRFTDARHDRVARVAHLTRLVAAGARPDPVALARAHLGHEVGVGDLGAGHLHAVAQRRVVVAAERPLGLADVDDRPLQDHRDVDRRLAPLRHTSTLKPVGSWKSGRVFSAEKIEPRVTTR